MAMPGYTKLFNSILASTIWEADMPTRIVWITLLAMADKNGIAEGSVPGLATFARVSVKDCRKALAALMAPDPDSRSQEYDGRRIEAVEGGWRLINHAKYRAKLSADERREYNRQKQREHRQRQKASAEVKNVIETYAPSAHTEADTKAVQDQDHRNGRALWKIVMTTVAEEPEAGIAELSERIKERAAKAGIEYLERQGWTAKLEQEIARHRGV